MNSPVRTVLTAAAIVLAVAACGKKEASEQAQQPGAAAQEEKVLHVFNWSDYIAEDTVPNFEKQSGIKVTYDVFDSNDVLETRLLRRQLRLRRGRTVGLVPRAADQGGRVPEAGQEPAAEPEEHGPGHHEPRRPARSGQRVRDPVPVGHDRHRLQRGQDQEDPRQTRRRTAGTTSSTRRTPPSSRTAASRCSMRRTRSSRSCSPGSGAIRTARRRRT